MVFSSTSFLFIFLPILLLAYFIPIFKNSIEYKNFILLLGSFVFYSLGEPVFAWVMVANLVINWFIAIQMDKEQQTDKRKILCTIVIIIDLALLFVFKYLTFATSNIHILSSSLPVIQIALPIGISFYTFQIMSYVWDVYYRKVPSQKNILHLSLYALLFPQLVAGPIVRYKDIADRIDDRQTSICDFGDGMVRFTYGLGKKVILANYMGVVADKIFASYDTNSLTTAWLGAICYSLQIFYDFSGYSDMAIGLGRIFGFVIPENFDKPYISKSVTEFWRRWHITLSSWFRDYVYIPLGGNRCSKSKWIRNLFIVWLLTGIWHGANWTFILWGLYYFVFLLLEKLFYKDFLEKHKVFGHIYTIVIFVTGWVIFKADSISIAFEYIKHMFSCVSNSFSDSMFMYYLDNAKILLALAIICLLPIEKFVGKLFKNSNSKLLVKVAFSIFLLIVSSIYCTASTYNPFIYFNF